MSRLFSVILVIFALTTGMGAVGQQSELGKSFQFDGDSINAWLALKEQQSPKAFEAGDCLNSDFMTENQASCLTKQALFLLSEINQRREIGLEAIRRTLDSSESKRLAATAKLRDAQLAAALAATKIKRSEALSVENASLKTQLSENVLAENSSVEKQVALRAQNQLLEKKLIALTKLAEQKTEQLDYAQSQILTLETKLVAHQGTYASVIQENKVLKKANLAVSEAYKKLTDKLRFGLLASLTN